MVVTKQHKTEENECEGWARSLKRYIEMGLQVPDTFILCMIDLKYSKYRLDYSILSLLIHIQSV